MWVCTKCGARFAKDTAHCLIDGATVEWRFDPTDPHAVGNRYRIGDLIGCGRTHQVHRAVSRADGRVSAVKLLVRPDDEAHAARENEHRVLASVSDPRLPAVFEREDRPNQRYFVMALRAGDAIAERISQGDVFAPDAALEIAREIALALAAIHGAGFTHGNLSARKVLLDAGGAQPVTVLGPGLRRVRPRWRHDAIGFNLFDLICVAPELERGGSPTPASDFFALGSVLRSMLTATRVPATLPIGSLAGVPGLVQDGIDDLLSRLLCTTPAWRYVDATRVVAAIDQRLRELRQPRATGTRTPVGALNIPPPLRDWIARGQVYTEALGAGPDAPHARDALRQFQQLVDHARPVRDGTASATAREAIAALVAREDAMLAGITRAEHVAHDAAAAASTLEARMRTAAGEIASAARADAERVAAATRSAAEWAAAWERARDEAEVARRALQKLWEELDHLRHELAVARLDHEAREAKTSMSDAAMGAIAEAAAATEAALGTQPASRAVLERRLRPSSS